jgi:hypothetical protein
MLERKQLAPAIDGDRQQAGHWADPKGQPRATSINSITLSDR